MNEYYTIQCYIVDLMKTVPGPATSGPAMSISGNWNSSPGSTPKGSKLVTEKETILN